MSWLSGIARIARLVGHRDDTRVLRLDPSIRVGKPSDPDVIVLNHYKARVAANVARRKP